MAPTPNSALLAAHLREDTADLLALLPAAYLLSLTGRLELVWLAFPIAEIISVTISTLCLRHLYQTEIKRLEGPPVQAEE